MLKRLSGGERRASGAPAELADPRLAVVLGNPANQQCADCTGGGASANPKWAATNLGVLICLNCSGVHRSLGTDISKVRSVVLDRWDDEQLRGVEAMGNDRANALWEAELPEGVKPHSDAPQEARQAFIRDKYVLGKFAKAGTVALPDLAGRREAGPVSKSRAGLVEYQGMLTIHLLGAKRLKATDVASGSCDPYCVFKHCGQSVKSDYVKKSRSPFWNEMLNLMSTDLTKPLELQCFDYDRLSRDDPLGDAAVSLMELEPGVKKEFVVKLLHTKKGTVYFSVLLTQMDA